MSDTQGAGATAPAPDDTFPNVRRDMNEANAALAQRIGELEAAMSTRDPMELPEVGVIAELATARIDERMSDLEDTLSRLAETMVASPDDTVDGAIAAVQAEMGGIEVGKTANIVSSKGSYSYSYITEGQITAVVRTKLCSRGVAIYVSEVSSVKDGSLTTVTVDVTFAHARSGSERVIRMTGQGTDPGDKGHTKALTTAIRVGLCKQFLQSGDLDPEDSNDDHVPYAAPTAPTPAPAAANPRQGLYETFARWTGGDVDQLKELTAAMAVPSIKSADDEQVRIMQDFVAWVRGQDHDVMQGRINDEGWPAIAKRWWQTEGSISL